MGSCVTARGIKAIIPYQHKYQSTYLWGSYSPLDGDSFVWEINGVNTDIFNAYHQALSQHRPKE